MFAVIFRAELSDSCPDYSALAGRLRELAVRKYGCVEFCSCTERNHEVTISWWKTLEQIERWKQDSEHRRAQELGRSGIYRSYRVQVVEIIRDYAGGIA